MFFYKLFHIFNSGKPALIINCFFVFIILSYPLILCFGLLCFNHTCNIKNSWHNTTDPKLRSMDGLFYSEDFTIFKHRQHPAPLKEMWYWHKNPKIIWHIWFHQHPSFQWLITQVILALNNIWVITKYYLWNNSCNSNTYHLISIFLITIIYSQCW